MTALLLLDYYCTAAQIKRNDTVLHFGLQQMTESTDVWIFDTYNRLIHVGLTQQIRCC